MPTLCPTSLAQASRKVHSENSKWEPRNRPARAPCPRPPHKGVVRAPSHRPSSCPQQVTSNDPPLPAVVSLAHQTGHCETCWRGQRLARASAHRDLHPVRGTDWEQLVSFVIVWGKLEKAHHGRLDVRDVSLACPSSSSKNAPPCSGSHYSGQVSTKSAKLLGLGYRIVLGTQAAPDPHWHLLVLTGTHLHLCCGPVRLWRQGHQHSLGVEACQEPLPPHRQASGIPALLYSTATQSHGCLQSRVKTGQIRGSRGSGRLTSKQVPPPPRVQAAEPRRCR